MQDVLMSRYLSDLFINTRFARTQKRAPAWHPFSDYTVSCFCLANIPVNLFAIIAFHLNIIDPAKKPAFSCLS